MPVCTCAEPSLATHYPFNATLAPKVLKEEPNLVGKLGCGLCVLGSTVMVIHSPKGQEVSSIDQLQAMMVEPAFIVYATLVVIVTVFLMLHTAPRYGDKNVLVYIRTCSSLGSLTVMGCKVVSVSIKDTFRGQTEFTNWLFYILLFLVIVCNLIQLNYLNRDLDTSNTAVVTPICYVFFSSLVMVASLILFKEWGNMKPEDILGDLCGFLTIICVIFLLNAFKDVNISLRSLPSLTAASGEGTGSILSSASSSVDHCYYLLQTGQPEGSLSDGSVTEYTDISRQPLQ